MGLIFHQLVDAHTELGIWHIVEPSEELQGNLILDDEEREHITSLTHPERALHWLGGRNLLRKLLNTGAYIDCRTDAYNKPVLLNMPYHISLSHAKDYAAAMISSKNPVGIDIEVMEEKIGRMAPRFLSAEELRFISEKNRIEHLYACWGAKEALFKLYGKGGLPFIGGIVLEPFDIEQEGTIKGRINKTDYPENLLINYRIFDPYMLVYASGPPGLPSL